MSKKYYWKMNGHLYEVSEEQYKKYKKEYDRSRTLAKQRKEVVILSFDALDTDEYTGESIFADPNTDIETEVVGNIMREKLNRALNQLSEEEIFLIEQLYYLNQSDGDWRKYLNYHRMQYISVNTKLKKFLQKQNLMITNV